MSSYFIFFKGGSNNKNVRCPINNNAAEGKINPTQTTDQSTSKNSLAAKKLSSKQIKDILKDTTGFIRFQKATASVPGNTKDSQNSIGKNSSATILPAKKSQPVESGRMRKVQYTVVDTTYFHDKPDERTRRKSYLDPLNKNILKPIDDENGFIYIVYTNRFGITSKGWINKKDLRLLR